jgi:uncharacterized protein (TIGR03083 family)
MAAKPDYRTLVTAERAAFAELLRSMSDEELGRPSLCDGWSYRDVACHVAATNRAGILGSLGGLLRSGFSPDRMSARDVSAWGRRPFAEVVEAVAEPRISGLLSLSPAGALTEIFLHQQDVRRPAAQTRAYPAECLAAALDASCKVATGTGSKKRVRGLQLRAADIDWSLGEGPEVIGPAEALILAVNGRASALADLAGDGVALLRERQPAAAVARSQTAP